MRLRVLIFYIFFFPLSIFPQQYGWYVVAKPPEGFVTAIEFVDSLYGWIQTYNGLRRTTDGGLSWSAPSSGIRVVLNSICFFNRKTGWAIGTNSIHDAAIYKTNDSGKTWQEVYFSYHQDANSGYGLNIQKVIAVGQDKNPPFTDTAIIIKTTNGGNNFTITHYTEPSKLQLKKVGFTDEQYGWICGWYEILNVGVKGLLLKTNDGGESWTPIDLPSPFQVITFLDSIRGWAWNGGYFIKTLDGGNSWDSLFSINQNLPAFKDLVFVDMFHGWSFGSMFYNGQIKEAIYKTVDGGNTWERESVGLSKWAEDGIMLSQFLGYAAGGDAVLKYGIISSVEKLEEMPKGFLLRNNYPNPFNSSTIIEYEIPERSDVVLKVFDVLGKEVQTLVNQEQEAGVYRVNFNGSSLSSGTYFFSLKTSNYGESKQMILLK